MCGGGAGMAAISGNQSWGEVTSQYLINIPVCEVSVGGDCVCEWFKGITILVWF